MKTKMMMIALLLCSSSAFAAKYQSVNCLSIDKLTNNPEICGEAGRLSVTIFKIGSEQGAVFNVCPYDKIINPKISINKSLGALAASGANPINDDFFNLEITKKAAGTYLGERYNATLQYKLNGSEKTLKLRCGNYGEGGEIELGLGDF